MAKLLYGDRRPGRVLSAKIVSILGIAIQLWDDPAPKGWKPHRRNLASTKPAKGTAATWTGS